MEICQIHLELLRPGKCLSLVYTYLSLAWLYHKLFHCRGNVVEIVLNLATVTLVRLVCVWGGTGGRTMEKECHISC